MKCIKRHEIKVLKTNDYYIGTQDQEGFPHCRVSENYYKTKEEAQNDLNSLSFEVRDNMENSFCNNGNSCMLFLGCVIKFDRRRFLLKCMDMLLV